MPDDLDTAARAVAAALKNLPLPARVAALNRVREIIGEASPFSDEPVDVVTWVPAESVKANDYNPNSVAPPEMRLLAKSITADGYTQPIVAMPDGDQVTVIDGFHRHRVGKEVPEVRERVHGYLPIVRIKVRRAAKTDRMASTIRHNRARGKHRVDAMSDIVVELIRRGWSHARVAEELGMEDDEVLRLAQITGLASAFADRDFSAAWEVGS